MTMPILHATAVVDPGATIGLGSSIGPYAVIEAGVQIGEGVVIGPHVVIKSGTELGDECRVHAGAVLGDDPQDLAFDRQLETRLVVQARTVIREHVTIHRATDPARPTRIGQDCLLMAHSHVGHDAHLGSRVILCNSALIAGHVEVQDRAFLSGNTVVHQFCRVGEGVMLSGVSGVNRDVGPYLTVAERSDVVGINTVGLRRAGMNSERRRRVVQAYRALFSAPSLEGGLEAVRALESSEEPEIRRILDFYQGTKRGYARPRCEHPLAQHAAPSADWLPEDA